MLPSVGGFAISSDGYFWLCTEVGKVAFVDPTSFFNAETNERGLGLQT